MPVDQPPVMGHDLKMVYHDGNAYLKYQCKYCRVSWHNYQWAEDHTEKHPQNAWELLCVEN